MTSGNQHNEMARQLVKRYSRKWLITRWECEQAITGLTETHQDYARTRWKVATRLVVVKETALSAVTKDLLPQSPVSPNSIDPWAVEPYTLPNTSRQIVTCKTCQGEKKVTCSHCQGTTRATCDECRGSGTVPAKRGGLKKCPRCKATGQRKCKTCKAGFVTCSPCDGHGLIQRWLEITERTEEMVYGQEQLPGGHARYAWPTFIAVTQKPEAQPFEVILAWQGTSPDDAPEAAQVRLLSKKPSLDSLTMRVQEVEVQIVRLRMQHVHLRFAGKDGQIAVDPQQKLVLPLESERAPLIRRLMIMGGLTFLSLLWASSVFGNYTNQHPYYAANGISPFLSLMVWLIMVLTWVTSALLCLPQETPLARKRKHVAAGLLGCLLLQFGCSRMGHPSAKHAQDQLELGRTEAALRELDAAIHHDHDREAAQELFDGYHLKKVKEATSYKEVISYATFAFEHSETQEQALAHLKTLAEKEIGQSFQAKNFHAVESDVSGLPQPLRSLSTRLEQLYISSLKSQGENCIQRFDKPCLNTYAIKLRQARAPQALLKGFYRQAATRVDTEARKVLAGGNTSFNAQEKACGQLNALLTGLDGLELAKTSAQPQQYRQTCEQWKTQRVAYYKAEAARKVRAEEYAKQQVAAAAARQQAAEERQRIRDTRPIGVLMCNDGTPSPTCSCPGHRGCCSHHGGIAGCS
jgi:hypothetical protein